MRISIRRSFGDAPEVHTREWSQVCDLYRQSIGVPFKGPTPTEKPLDLPLIGFCAFTEHDQKGPPGCRRGNMHPEGLWALTYDFDGAESAAFADMLERVKAFGPGLAHTTWKHNIKADGLVRARLVLPIPEGPAPIYQWQTAWSARALVLGERLALDMQCNNPERLWYLPCVNLDAPPGSSWLAVW